MKMMPLVLGLKTYPLPLFFLSILVTALREWDLNPRPPAYEAGEMTELLYPAKIYCSIYLIYLQVFATNFENFL
jgi:hypothetical protein